VLIGGCGVVFEVAEICVKAVSLLPKLEPILGAGLGINLAYLNLPPFGYITRVRDIVNSGLESLPTGTKEVCASAKWFKQLSALSEVKDLDQNYYFLKDRVWVSAPGLWGVFYNIFFYWRLARIFAVFATIYILILLIWGTGQDMGILKNTGCLYSGSFIRWHWVLSLLAFLWPIIVVSVGTFIGIQAKLFINYQIGDLAKEQKDKAVQALNAADVAVNQKT
jgi:hypothetical protein